MRNNLNSCNAKPQTKTTLTAHISGQTSGRILFFGCSCLEKMNIKHKAAMGLGVFEITEKS